ncbi:phosphatase PAP2 family protein [Mucilaginibacter corticis]|uniref:Phosphatase PAP2 family protein n=1 Tax=Mucilaginibacter corticis TaxID=2597670 RepID=A0A556MF71_9SPHI|nr:phosphatase PAP2 family protein [Mucilaginibacter corticis]TSJ38547.1 phosphatase PAP2 family protein [Mucilaginibacter corticis]
MNIGIKAVLYNVRFFFIPYLILIAACLIIKLTFTREEIYFAVNARYSNWADWLAPYLTDLGNGWTTVALSAIILLFSYRKAFILASAYAVTSLSAQVLKFAFDAPRPKLYFHDQLSRIHFVAGTDQLSLHSFPSGHTVTAFSTAILITYWCKNKTWGLPLLLLAALVGYSRMYLSQHFFEDVTAGSVVGVLLTVIWIWWAENWKFLKSPKWNRGLLSN